MITKIKDKLANASKCLKNERNKSLKQNNLTSKTTISNTPNTSKFNQNTNIKRNASQTLKKERVTLPYNNKSNNKVFYSKNHASEMHLIKREFNTTERKLKKNLSENQNIINNKITTPKNKNQINTNLQNSSNGNKDFNPNKDFQRKTKLQTDCRILFESCLSYFQNDEDDDNFNVYFSNVNEDKKEKYRKTNYNQVSNEKKSEIYNLNISNQQKDILSDRFNDKNRKKNIVINLINNNNFNENSVQNVKQGNNNKENKISEINLENCKVNYNFGSINYKNKKLKKKLLNIFYNKEKKQKIILGKIELNSGFFIEKNSEFSLNENNQNNSNSKILRPFFRFWKKVKIINKTKKIKKLDLKKDKNIIIRTVVYKADKSSERIDFRNSCNNNILKSEKIKKIYEKFDKSYIKIYSNLLKKYFNKLKQYYIFNKKKNSIEKLISFFHNYYNVRNKIFFFKKIKEIQNYYYQQNQKENNIIFSSDHPLNNSNNELLLDDNSNDIIWTETAGKWMYQKNNKTTDSMNLSNESEIKKQKERWTKNIENFYLIEVGESSDSLYEVENENNQENLNADKIIKINTFLLNEVLQEEYGEQNKNNSQNNKGNEIKNEESKESGIKNEESKENGINENKNYQKLNDNYQCNEIFENENLINEYYNMENIEGNNQNEINNDINRINYQDDNIFKNMENENNAEE